MNGTWLSSQRSEILLALPVLAAGHLVAQMFGVDLLPTLAADTGMLLLWGIGHCDTLDGPLVKLGERALEERNVNLVLPWVRPDDEPEIRHAFDHAQAVRSLGPDARSLADRHFLETLVRIHRAGEGAPFTGLKPAGLHLGPAVPAADRALETGSVEAVVRLLVDAVSTGVRTRFQAAAQRQRFEPNDVAAGRRYVEAYVFADVQRPLAPITFVVVRCPSIVREHNPAARSDGRRDPVRLTSVRVRAPRRGVPALP